MADTSSKLERTKSKDKITETLVRINSDRRCVAQDLKGQSEMRQLENLGLLLDK